MRKSVYSHAVTFLAGLALGVLLTAQIPKMLKAQKKVILHPDYTQGFLWQTDNPYDIAIKGRGYFEFSKTDGTRVYSRYSHFRLDNTGTLVSKDTGYLLEPGIKIQQGTKQMMVQEDGILSMIVAPMNTKMQAGIIQLAIFTNPDSLDTTDDENYYQESEKSGPPAFLNPGQGEAGILKQGYTMVK